MAVTLSPPPSPHKPSPMTGLSTHMTIVLVFLTHGFVNSFLLTPWNPFRSFYWNATSLEESETWMLNWFTAGHFQIYTLLACLFAGIRGAKDSRLEERLVYLCATLVTCSLSTGIFSLDILNRPMAALMGFIYLSLLAAVMYQSTIPSQSSAAEVLARKLFRSHDRRSTVSMSTIAVTVIAILTAVRGVEVTFGEGLDLEGVTPTVIYQRLLQASACQTVWATLILFWSAVQATAEQQKAILMGQFLIYFVSILLLAGPQGELMPPPQARAVGVSNFFGMCIALVGAS